MNIRLYFDGACQPQNPGVGTWAFIVCCHDGHDVVRGSLSVREDSIIHRSMGVVDGGRLSTNNRAEYYALGHGLKWIRENEEGLWTKLFIYGDSQLVIYQSIDQWKCRSDTLRPLCERVKDNLSALPMEWQAEWIPRHLNELADRMSSLAYCEFLKRHKHPQESQP